MRYIGHDAADARKHRRQTDDRMERCHGLRQTRGSDALADYETEDAANTRQRAELRQDLRTETNGQKGCQYTGGNAEDAEKIASPGCRLRCQALDRANAEDRADHVTGLHESSGACTGCGNEPATEKRSWDGVQPGVLGWIRGPCNVSAFESLSVYRICSRLNMSNILLVMTKPPETFTKARSTDAAPRACGIVSGR